MKRLLILLLALMPVMVSAQKYKPLDPVEVPDEIWCRLQVDEREFPGGGTYYMSGHSLYTRTITAYMGVPFTYSLALQIRQPEIPIGITAKFFIGGEEYSFPVDFVSDDKRVYVDIMGAHVKHIAVSGIQKIVFHKYGDIVHTQEFSLVEQEMWRRTSEELMKAIDKYKVL